MDDIKDLIKIVAYHTKKKLPLLDLKSQHQNGNKEINLFLGIKNGQYTDEVEASQGIYGTEGIDLSFRMLKSRLSRKLLNHLFFMDFTSKNFSSSANFYQETLDSLHLSRILLNANETKLGTKLLIKTLDLAKAGEYTSIIIDCLKSLRELYAKSYRPKLFRSHNEEVEKYIAQQRIEERADDIFQRYQLRINSTVNNRKWNLEPFEKAVHELEQLHKKTKSYNVYERYIRMQIWYLEHIGDFESLLKFTRRLEREYAKGKINRNRFDNLHILYAKSNALIKLQKFKEGRRFLEQMLNEIDDSLDAWYVFAEKYVMLRIKNKQFKKASEIFFRVANNKSLHNLKETEKLRWNIYRSYLYYLTGDKKIIKKFDYDKFIEETPEYKKENAGYTVAILILQMLVHSTGDLAILEEKLHALEDYVRRYLNNSYSKRTKTFCKLLRKIVVHDRDFEIIDAKSKYLCERLTDAEVAGETYLDFEIVPYELLWQLVMKGIIELNKSDAKKTKDEDQITS